MAFNEITKSTVTVLEGKIVSVRQDCVVLSDGSESMREVVEHPGGVCIAAVDKDRNIYLVEQFRYPMGETVLELPAGKLEKGENPDHAAVRELREETGLVSENLRRVGVLYPTPGYCSEKLYLYLAENLTEGPQQLDTGELLSCFKRPLADVVPLVLDNTIRDAKTALLILLTDRLLTSRGAPL